MDQLFIVSWSTAILLSEPNKLKSANCFTINAENINPVK